MEQVRAQRAPRSGGGAGVRRAVRWGWTTFTALCVAGASASAQRVTQQATPRTATTRFDVDSAMARATLLRRQNRKAEAERVMVRAAEVAPDRADVRALRDLLRQEVHGGEAMLGAEVKSWREQLPEWREGIASVRQNTAAGPVVARVSRVERNILSDERLEVEAYPAFPHGYLALGAGLATGATVYARTTASAEVYGSLTNQVEASVGYRRMNFDTGIDMIGGSLGAYAGTFLLGVRGSRVLRGGGSSVMLSTRRFVGDEGAYVGATLATGSVPVDLRTPTDFAVRFNQAASLEGRVNLLRHLLLTAEGELGREGLLAGGSSPYSAMRVGIGVRY